MTLHLTQVSNLYTLQVADRLVSGRTNDPMANKNVIYAARDAIVTLGYTGLAYDLDYPDRLIPTDEWIASQLLGGPIPRVFDPVRPPAGGNIQNAHWLSIGDSIQHLKKEMEKVFQKLPSTLAKHRFELIIAGWLLPKRRFIRPFVAEMLKAPNERTLKIEFPMRGRRFETRFGLWATPSGYLTKSEGVDLSSSLRPGDLAPRQLAQLAEKRFVETIRSVAKRNPRAVGAHCMSIIIPPPTSDGAIRVRFHPASEHRATIRSNRPAFEVPVAYTPWILGRGQFFAPSVVAGAGKISYQLGPFTIEFFGPDVGSFIFIGSQSRPANR